MGQRPSHSRLAAALALAALFAFSGPGVGVAHAERDLAPSADELFGARRTSVSGPAVACDPARAQAAAVSRRQAAARLTQLMKGDGSGRALRNGHGYEVQRSPLVQLRRIEAEAAAQRAAAEQ